MYGTCASDSLVQASLALDSGHPLCQQLDSLGTVTSRKAKNRNELSASEKALVGTLVQRPILHPKAAFELILHAGNLC